MQEIIFDTHSITFRRSFRAKRIRLSLDLTGKFNLAAPFFVPESEIHVFLKRHRAWIHKQAGMLTRARMVNPVPVYKTGDVFYYFGEPVVLSIRVSDRLRPTARVRGNELIVELHPKKSGHDSEKNARDAIDLFYRKKATEVIFDRLEHFNEFFGFRYGRVTLRNQKSRWGSCSMAGNLNFNRKLIMAPIEIIDYVVVHELCHLREMNHSPRFWGLVAKVIPDYKARRIWLKKNQFLLASV